MKRKDISPSTEAITTITTSVSKRDLCNVVYEVFRVADVGGECAPWPAVTMLGEKEVGPNGLDLSKLGIILPIIRRTTERSGLVTKIARKHQNQKQLPRNYACWTQNFEI